MEINGIVIKLIITNNELIQTNLKKRIQIKHKSLTIICFQLIELRVFIMLLIN